ncbi:MAG TPA: Gfo/Idh/MocA family oxidoreductase [Candidatus Sulfopaludibacter sp.]|jgi:predicted dehydrogenase|nr:Gfo/Idh/MocA family oxidoreductase [Candidatus Sulfopaludibacter sp.]
MKRITRRDMLATSTAVGCFSFFPARVLGRGGATPPSEKLNIAMIGTGGRGAVSLRNLTDHNIVALCDVDWRTESRSEFPAGKMAAQYPQAKRFDDYRIMLAEMDKSIDAVVVATADHSHAHASIAAMRMKKHVYCEKPLAHDMHEVRAMMAAAKKYNVITQTGNQGHSNYDVRSLVEWVRAGAIGSVKEVHLFEGAGRRPAPAAGKVGTVAWTGQYDFTKILSDDIPVPPEIKWDLWLGPAPTRKFNPAYLPLSWRRWLDFGTGVMGDFVCHYLDPVAWSLDLELPESIEAETDEAYNPQTNNQTYPNYSQLRCAYPARGNKPPVTVSWYLNSPARPPRPQGWKEDEKLPDESGGGMIVGSQGSILFGKVFHGSSMKSTPGLVRLYPDDLDKSFKRPDMTIPRLQAGGDLGGHWLDWVDSIKAGKQAGSHFGYGGMLSKSAVIGNIAVRNKGKILRFNAKDETIINDDDANKLFQRRYREGWNLPT